MQLVNIDYIPGKELEVLEIVKGTVVYSKNFGKDDRDLNQNSTPELTKVRKVSVPPISHFF